MKNMLRNIILLLMCGVFGDTGEEKTETVMEGDPVTLHTDIQRDLIDLLWRFGEAGSQKLIVQMKGNKVTYVEYVDGRFRDRLQISDTQTGSLTIKNMRLKHSGLYEAEISTGSGTTYKKFRVTVSESADTEAETDEVKTESVMEGYSLTLLNDIQTQRDDLILWRFGDKGVLIAKADKENNKSSLYDDDEGRFKGRLQLDDQTGSLTITNSRTDHSGLYKLKISSSIRETKYKIFSVAVRDAGLSSWAKAGICISVLLVIAAAAAGVIFYRRMSEEKKLLDNMKTETVMKGDHLTLSSGVTDIQSDDVIEWRFRETLIAEIKRKEMKFFTDDDDVQRFRDRLMLNDQTGDLTIRDIRPDHAGHYKLKIITSGGTSESLFNVVVRDMKTVSVMETHPLTLHTGVTDIQSDDDVIEWRFREILIAEIKRKKMKISTDDDDVQRFRDRLELNDQTGDLTISNIRHKHTGYYKLKIITSGGTSQSLFNVVVSDYMETVTVTEGDPVTLYSGVTHILSDDDVIQWRFGETLIAEIKRKKMKIFTDDDDVQRFRDRLKLNDQTGDLTISYIRHEDAGHYKLKIITSGGTSQYLFNVVVRRRIPDWVLMPSDSAGIRGNDSAGIRGNDSAGIRGNDSVSVGIPLLNEAEDSF